jgi:hypothetical protein
MLEIRRNQDPTIKRNALLFIDGVYLENAFVSMPRDDSYCSVTSKDTETSKKITAYAFSDFPFRPDYVDFWFYPDDIEHLDIRGISLYQGQTEESEDVLFIGLTLGGDALTEWHAPYSFADYVYEMYPRLDRHNLVYEANLFGKDDKGVSFINEPVEGKSLPRRVKIDLDEIDRRSIHSLYLKFTASFDNPIADEVERVAKIVREVHSEVLNQLLSRLNSRSVVASFKDFPKEVRTYCEQYLMYFIQFLQDLGVDATSELKHEAGQVLFTVTPSNEHEALDKIRTALNVYLHLPSSPLGNEVSTDIAVNRLESAVLRLQSDLRLAAAELQAKNATIEAQQLTINVQKSLLNGEIRTGAFKDVTPKQKDEDREEFFDGAAALTVLKKEGYELNLPKIYRRLKELFTEKE